MSTRPLYFIFILLAVVVIGLPFSSANAIEMEPDEPVNATPTPTPTASPTSTPSPLFNAHSPPSFFAPELLDDFNRPDGALGSNWSGDTSGYAIASQQLGVGTSEDIYWNVSSFGVDQEAFITLATIGSADEIGLILKAQSNTGVGAGLIDVLYHPASGVVQVWTFDTTAGWQQRGSDISVTFNNGDKFSAQARATGHVEVYRNDISIGIRTISAWPFFASSGYLGLFNVNASGVVLDDFGGGTVDDLPTPTPTPIPCHDPLTCDPVTAYPAYWRCNIPECTGSDWLGAVISWPSWSAYSNNNRTLNNSRTVYSIETDEPLYAYMGPWAHGCEITAVSGTVLIIEWQRGTDVWEAFFIDPGESHTIDLVPPQDGAMVEGPDDVTDAFQVSISNCTPQNIHPTAIQLVSFEANSLTQSAGFAQAIVFVGMSIMMLRGMVLKRKMPAT